MSPGVTTLAEWLAPSKVVFATSSIGLAGSVRSTTRISDREKPSKVTRVPEGAVSVSASWSAVYGWSYSMETVPSAEKSGAVPWDESATSLSPSASAGIASAHVYGICPV